MVKRNKKCEYCDNFFTTNKPNKKYCGRTHQVKAQKIRQREAEKDKFITVEETNDIHFVEEILIVKHSDCFRVTTRLGTDIIGNYTICSSELHFLDGVLVSMKPNGLLITGHYDSVDDVNEKICYVFNDGELIIGSSRRQIEDYLKE